MTSVCTHIVALADLDTVVTEQQRLRRGHMEEKLRQSIIQQVPVAGEVLFYRRARTQHDFALCAAVEAQRIEAGEGT